MRLKVPLSVVGFQILLTSPASISVSCEDSAPCDDSAPCEDSASSEDMALNAVLGHGYKVNIFDSLSCVVHGREHNRAGDTILLLRFSGAHYTSLECAYM